MPGSAPRARARLLHPSGCLSSAQALPLAFCSMRLSFFDRPTRVGCDRYVLTLESVSPHQLHFGKTHELRAMNARPSSARAAARPSFGSAASACTLPARSPSNAAWATADSMGGG